VTRKIDKLKDPRTSTAQVDTADKFATALVRMTAAVVKQSSDAQHRFDPAVVDVAAQYSEAIVSRWKARLMRGGSGAGMSTGARPAQTPASNPSQAQLDERVLAALSVITESRRSLKVATSVIEAAERVLAEAPPDVVARVKESARYRVGN
jgi:hypothetical protein